MHQRTCEIVERFLLRMLSRRCAHIESNVVVNTELRLIIDFHAKIVERINSKWDCSSQNVWLQNVFTSQRNKCIQKKNEKMKSRTFIEYLIKYDFINIFRVWNSKKNDVSDYRDVIFNEMKFFDTYEVVDLFKKEKRKFYVTYRAISLQIFENSDEKQYDRILIRKHVLNNSRKNVVSKSMMKKEISSSIEIFQLSTFDDTLSFEFESTSTINIFVTIEILKQNVSKKNKKMISFFRKVKSLNKKNNFSFQKNNFLYFHSSNLSNDLFEIDNAFLNVLISRNINFRINEITLSRKKEFEDLRKILRTRLE
jgi:hypothetical protein